jgi:hypothetical protein
MEAGESAAVLSGYESRTRAFSSRLAIAPDSCTSPNERSMRMWESQNPKKKGTKYWVLSGKSFLILPGALRVSRPSIPMPLVFVDNVAEIECPSRKTPEDSNKPGALLACVRPRQSHG